MKSLFQLIALFVVAYAGYVLWQNHSAKSTGDSTSAQGSTDTSATAPVAPAPASAGPADATASAPSNITPPTPLIASAAVAAPASRENFTPDGIYYLTQRVSVTNQSGVIGINPGTRVKLINNLGTTLHVTDGQIDFDVDPSQITNDMGVVVRLGQSEAQKAAALAALMQARKQELQSQAQQQNQSMQDSQSTVAKNESVEKLQNQFAALQQQETGLRAQLAKDLDAYYSRHARVHDVIPGYGTIMTEQQQLSQIVESEGEIRNQISALQH